MKREWRRGWTTAVARWALGSLPERRGWAEPGILPGEAWEAWAARAAQELQTLAARAAEQAGRRASPSDWALALGRAAKGLVAGHLISLALSIASFDGQLKGEAARCGWIVAFWELAKDEAELSRRQRAARSDSGAALPWSFASDPARGGGWRPRLLRALEWIFIAPLAPLGWCAALGAQGALARASLRRASKGLALCSLDMASGNPGRIFEGWLEACRWLDLLGTQAGPSQVAVLEALAAPGAPPLDAVRDVDAGWRRDGSARDEAGRRAGREQALSGLSAMLMLGSAVGRCCRLEGPARAEAAQAAFGMLSRAWESKAPAFARAQGWRWRDAAVAACDLLGPPQTSSEEHAGAGACDAWEAMGVKASLARELDSRQDWPKALKASVAGAIAMEAARRAGRPGDAGSIDPDSGPGLGAELEGWASEWARRAVEALDGFTLDAGELAEILMSGIARNPAARLAPMLMGPWRAAVGAMAKECSRAMADWEAARIAEAAPEAPAGRGLGRL